MQRSVTVLLASALRGHVENDVKRETGCYVTGNNKELHIVLHSNVKALCNFTSVTENYSLSTKLLNNSLGEISVYGLTTLFYAYSILQLP